MSARIDSNSPRDPGDRSAILRYTTYAPIRTATVATANAGLADQIDGLPVITGTYQWNHSIAAFDRNKASGALGLNKAMFPDGLGRVFKIDV